MSVSPKDWVPIPRDLELGYLREKSKGPTNISGLLQQSQAMPQLCFSLQLPRILVQQHLQPWSAFVGSAHAKWISMLSHTGINDSGARGQQPNSTPARRRRRTTHGHGLGPDARSCPHCGRTFKRTEHLDRHVRTRQSSHSVSLPLLSFTTPCIGVKSDCRPLHRLAVLHPYSASLQHLILVKLHVPVL